MSLGVILFASTHFAIRAEKLAKEKGFAVKLIPVPPILALTAGYVFAFPRIRKERSKTPSIKRGPNGRHSLPGLAGQRSIVPPPQIKRFAMKARRGPSLRIAREPSLKLIPVSLEFLIPDRVFPESKTIS